MLSITASHATAQPTETTIRKPGWRDRPRATGDWGGRRTRLDQRGLELGARYTAGFWSNVQGGFETGTRYEGFAEWSAIAQLEPLIGWKGGGAAITAYSYHGGQPSIDLVGVFETQTISGHESFGTFRFFEMYLSQMWGDDRYYLKAGQLAADNDFFASEVASHLLNGTFGFLGLTREISAFYPLATPGAYFRARTPDGRWEGDIGIYTADPGEDVESNHGFDYSFDNGFSILMEARTRRQWFGRSGSYALGFSVTNKKIENFETGGIANGDYGLFFSIDQAITRDNDSGPRVSIFIRGYGTPQQDRAKGKTYVDFGVTVERPFDSRDRDVFSVGVAWLHFADAYVAYQNSLGLDVSPDEAIIEFTYKAHLTGWLSLQPDMQIVLDPHYSRRDALVLGLRAVVDF